MHKRLVVVSCIFLLSACVDSLRYQSKDDICPQNSAQAIIHGECI